MFSLGLTFGIMITTSVIPSFWMYFADQKLKWNGAGTERLLVAGAPRRGRDGSGHRPIIVMLVRRDGRMQNWRRKLRGQSGDVRPAGGYR